MGTRGRTLQERTRHLPRPWVCEEQGDCSGDGTHGAEHAVSDRGEVPGPRSVGPTGPDPTSDVATRGCQQSDVMGLLFIRFALTTPRRSDYEGEEARAGTGSERAGTWGWGCGERAARPGGDLKTGGPDVWVMEERGQG